VAELPYLSLGLPVFNGETYIESTIRFWLEQPYKNIELIISDNASTDRTSEICKMFLSDPRVKYFRQEKNIVWENFSFVASKATHDPFMFVGDDDYWDEQALFVLSAIMVKEKLKTSRPVLVYGVHQMIVNERKENHFSNRMLIQFRNPSLALSWHMLTYATNGSTNPMWGMWSSRKIAKEFADLNQDFLLRHPDLALELGPDAYAYTRMRTTLHVSIAKGIRHYRRRWAREAGYFGIAIKKKYYEWLLPGVFLRVVKFNLIMINQLRGLDRFTVLMLFPISPLINYLLRKVGNKIFCLFKKSKSEEL